MEELIKFIASELVDNADLIEVKSTEESAKVTILELLVAKDDIGKVIGRNGKIANSLRTIVKSASAKYGKRFILKIGERD